MIALSVSDLSLSFGAEARSLIINNRNSSFNIAPGCAEVFKVKSGVKLLVD